MQHTFHFVVKQLLNSITSVLINEQLNQTAIITPYSNVTHIFQHFGIAFLFALNTPDTAVLVMVIFVNQMVAI